MTENLSRRAPAAVACRYLRRLLLFAIVASMAGEPAAAQILPDSMGRQVGQDAVDLWFKINPGLSPPDPIRLLFVSRRSCSTPAATSEVDGVFIGLQRQLLREYSSFALVRPQDLGLQDSDFDGGPREIIALLDRLERDGVRIDFLLGLEVFAFDVDVGWRRWRLVMQSASMRHQSVPTELLLMLPPIRRQPPPACRPELLRRGAWSLPPPETERARPVERHGGRVERRNGSDKGR